MAYTFSDAVKEKFPETPESDIRQALWQKCSNAVKLLKMQSFKKSVWASDFLFGTWIRLGKAVRVHK